MSEELPKYPIKPDIDTLLNDFNDVCDTGWVIKITGEHCWSVRASCEHTDYYQFTSEVATLTDTMVDLYKKVVEDHKRLENIDY